MLARRRKRVTLEDFDRVLKEGKVDHLNLILKGDVAGAVEALEVDWQPTQGGIPAGFTSAGMLAALKADAGQGATAEQAGDAPGALNQRPGQVALHSLGRFALFKNGAHGIIAALAARRLTLGQPAARQTHVGLARFARPVDHAAHHRHGQRHTDVRERRLHTGGEEDEMY